jgi:hypothetical protein
LDCTVVPDEAEPELLRLLPPLLALRIVLFLAASLFFTSVCAMEARENNNAAEIISVVFIMFNFFDE